jgi:hypothetical protein
MKKILIIFSLLITSSIVSMSGAQAEQCAVMGPNGCVLTETQAQASDNGGAGQCNASNPCGTWAVLDENSTVTNVIVCQSTVCGSGTFAGNSVVLQVSADTNGKPQGSVFVSNPNPNEVVTYDSVTATFTQGTAGFNTPVVRQDITDTVTLTTVIYSQSRKFTSNDYVNGQMQFTPVSTSTTGATISVEELNAVARQSYSTPQTRAQIQESIQGKLALIEKYLNRFYDLLKGWILD